MEANRDSSRQALAVAVAAEKEGNAAKAERFAQKSQVRKPMLTFAVFSLSGCPFRMFHTH